MTPDPGDSSNRSGDRLVAVKSGDLSANLVAAASDDAVFVISNDAVLQVEGPGALQCMQGLVTCDLEQAGDGTFSYAAFLTPKGMIVCDMWIARNGDCLTLFAPQEGAPVLQTAFERFLPPRLARITDVSGAWTVVRFLGPRALDLAGEVGLPPPAAGGIAERDGSQLALPQFGEPFVLQISCSSEKADQLLADLAKGGGSEGDLATIEYARVMAGWPRIGAEIDEKTLPQEVRLDDLGAVSFSKGCYLGQETVARVHFRGHTNRRLLGIVWETAPDLSTAEITAGQREVGRVTSVVSLDQNDLHIGLGLIRHEVDPGSAIRAAGTDARTAELPFGRDV